MNLDLLEAKGPFVTLHFNALPHQFPILRRAGNALSIQIPDSDLAGILSPGMRCRAGLPDGLVKEMVIDKVSRGKAGWKLECTLTAP